jgi:hypothetical protein
LRDLPPPLLFGVVVLVFEGGSAGTRYYAGYATEVALSVDDIFVLHSRLRGEEELMALLRLTHASPGGGAGRGAVLTNGKVVEQGTHEELPSRGGPYADSWKAWSR